MTEPVQEDALLRMACARTEARGMHLWGVHGIAHWWRVRHNGLLLADAMGADPLVVRLFAIFHDSHRDDDFADPEHGPRAAHWLGSIRSGAAPAACAETVRVIRGISESQFRALEAACRLHTSARSDDDPTVATCFAADRLDLARVGKRLKPALIPIPRSILTDELLAGAVERTHRGLAWSEPGLIERVWSVVPPPDRG